MTGNVRIIAVIGLIAGGVLGMAGSMVSSHEVRAVCWAIDGVGVILATAILAVAFIRAGRMELAVGFLIYTIGESVMLAGTAVSLEASVPSFAAGTALWSAGLVLVSVPRVFAIWTRITGLIAAILLGIVSLSIFRGVLLTPIAHPLPFFAYPFLVLTFAGWIWAIITRGAEFGTAKSASAAPSDAMAAR